MFLKYLLSYSGLHYLFKDPPLSTKTLMIKFQHMNLRETHSDHNSYGIVMVHLECQLIRTLNILGEKHHDVTVKAIPEKFN